MCILKPFSSRIWRSQTWQYHRNRCSPLDLSLLLRNFVDPISAFGMLTVVVVEEVMGSVVDDGEGLTVVVVEEVMGSVVDDGEGLTVVVVEEVMESVVDDEGLGGRKSRGSDAAAL